MTKAEESYFMKQELKQIKCTTGKRKKKEKIGKEEKDDGMQKKKS